MNNFGAIFRLQGRRMFTSKRFGAMFLVVMSVVALSYLGNCQTVWGYDWGETYSAAYGSVIRSGAFGVSTVLLTSIPYEFFRLFVFMISAFVFADIFFEDRRQGEYWCLIMRCSSSYYHMSSIVLSFIGAFVVISVPFFIGQLLAFAAFPFYSMTESLRVPFYDMRFIPLNTTVFPRLYLNHPYLTNIVYIFYDAVCAGLMAALSYVGSFFLRKTRLLVLAFPTIFYVIWNMVMDAFQLADLSLLQYQDPSGSGSTSGSIWVFFLFPAVILMTVVGILIWRLRGKADEL